MSARNRRHGHETERMVVRYLKEQGWPGACTTRAKLGHDGAHAPGDIDFEPGVCLEVKSVRASAWPSWRAQVLEEAQGRVAVVVRRTRGVRDVGAWECEVPTLDLIELGPDCLWPTGSRLCGRTRISWTRRPFGEVVALLKDDR